MLHMRNNREETQTVTPDEDRCGIRNGVMLPWLTLLAAHLDSSPRAGTASIVSTKLLNMTEVRLPSFSGHPICTDLVSVGEDVHCESTAEAVRAGGPA